MLLRDYIQNKKCIMDGAYGTYYQLVYQTNEPCELANTTHPQRILDIHKEYLDAGANVLRTNTFGSNTHALQTDMEGVKENLKSAYAIAIQAIDHKDNCFIFCNIGPIIDGTKQEYLEIVQYFYELGGRNFVFETFSSLEDIEDALRWLSTQNDTFVMTNFNVTQFGYTSHGLSLRFLFQEAKKRGADCVGCNCSIGPTQMHQLLSQVPFPDGVYRSACPNAGYPKRIQNQIIFKNYTEEYYVSNSVKMTEDGMDFIGGCCGTTPETIRQLATHINTTQHKHQPQENEESTTTTIRNHAFWNTKKKGPLIAVELAPPFDTNDTKVMEAAHMLKTMGVDVLTFPDSPSGRTRLDPILIADKVHRETQIPVMPHICCRDKNSLALRSQFLGSKINNIHNFLLITGDPIHVQSRGVVKSVFQFDSVGLMHVAQDLNQSMLSDNPLYYGGAINQERLNLHIEIQRVKRKMDAGATYFLTQPVFTQESVERLRTIKEATNARILCGIMPLVSKKNATFMKNEIDGIHVTDEIVARYPDQGTKEEGERVGVAIAKEMMEATKDFVDGYYFSFPFNRVYLLRQILDEGEVQ